MHAAVLSVNQPVDDHSELFTTYLQSCIALYVRLGDKGKSQGPQITRSLLISSYFFQSREFIEDESHIHRLTPWLSGTVYPSISLR